MLIEPIITNKNNTLILFFNGWSMDKASVTHLKSKNYDVVCVSDYTDIDNIDIIKNITSGYTQYYVIAWSLGVWNYSQIADTLEKPALSIAINGTNIPISEEFGLLPTVYQATIDNLSEPSKKKFDRRMFQANQEYLNFSENPVKRNIDSQKQELISIKDRYNANKLHFNPYNYAIVSNTDKIFLTDNQLKYWNNYLEPKIIDTGHYPFYNFNSWDEIIDMVVKDV